MLCSCRAFHNISRFTYAGSAPRLFVALVFVTIAAFAWLKRYSFVPSGAFLTYPYLTIGLSYIFFRVLHVMIDSHQSSINGRVGVVSYLNYTLNFASLTSGPIQRYQDYQRDELQRLPLDPVVMGVALERIIVGYFKVAVLSMAASTIQHQALDAVSVSQSLTDRVCADVLIFSIYPIYLYLNFSGYTDVVIGVARFFRMELPENFDRPFSSENVLTFWNRWHMTLSGWLKTYVYNPLMMAGMTRITAAALAPYVSVAVFFVTFFLVGLWHGQTSEFLFFGLLTGAGVATNKLYQVLMQQRLGRKGYRTLSENGLYRTCARGLTFTWFAFTLLWFWSNWRQLDKITHAVGALGVLLAWTAIYVGATITLWAMEAARMTVTGLPSRWEIILRSRYTRTAFLTVLVLITVLVTVLLNAAAPDIVYKTF
jgi:alginate O-acetyltransferase complex protein AlgI